MNKSEAIKFICYSEPVKNSFTLYLNEIDLYNITMEELMKTARDKAKEKGTSIGKLYDFFGRKIDENLENFKNQNVLYYHALSPFSFEESKKINLNIKENDLVKEVIEVFMSDSVLEFKQKIFERFDCPVEDQILKKGDLKLSDDEKTLRDYNISDGNTIILIPAFHQECSKPINFVDLSKNVFKDRNFSKDAPIYRTCYRGINLEGKCENESCKAFGKMVICPLKEMTTYNFVEDQYLIKCPLCDDNIDVETCGFNECWYSWSGTKKVGRKKTKESSLKKIYAPKDKYRRFDESNSGCGIATWSTLSIVVGFDEPDSEETCEKFFCAHCKMLDDQDSRVLKKNCDHFYHEDCFKTLASTCFLCTL